MSPFGYRYLKPLNSFDLFKIIYIWLFDHKCTAYDGLIFFETFKFFN